MAVLRWMDILLTKPYYNAGCTRMIGDRDSFIYAKRGIKALSAGIRKKRWTVCRISLRKGIRTLPENET